MTTSRKSPTSSQLAARGVTARIVPTPIDPDCSTPTPQEFRDGMQLVYAALAVGTALLNKNATELAAFIQANDPEVLTDIGQEIAAAREWWANIAAALTQIERRTLATAMSLTART